MVLDPRSQPGGNVKVTPLGDRKPPSSVAAHIDLGSEFYDYYSWSNAKDDLPIDTYFDPKNPNLGVEFGLHGLQPMLKDRNDDVYILKDANDHFYKFHIFPGVMYHLDTTEKDPMKVAMMVVEGISEMKWAQHWDPKTIRR